MNESLASALIGLPELSIRRAADREMRACRMLLPDMFTAHGAPDVLVALVNDPARGGAPTLAGAAGFGSVFGPGRSFPLSVHVLPAWRERGVGRALVAAAASCCRGRADALRPLRPVPSESQAAAFMSACGFEQLERIVHFEVDGLPFYADMLRVRQALERHGRIPPDARIVRLRDADREAVTDLVCRSVETVRSYVLARFAEDAPNPYDLDNSVALLVGGRVLGTLIYVWNAGVPVIEMRAVDPLLRGGWANALMLEEATRNAKECGATRFRFFASDTLADTMSLAKRAKAELIRIEVQLGLRL